MKSRKNYIYIAYAFLIMFGFNKIVLADGDVNCNSMGDLKTDLNNLFNVLKIVIPLLVIGLSMYDFIKAITAKDDKDIKKAFQKLIKRFVYAVLLFFLPVLINLLLDLIGTNSSVCIE